MKILEINSLSVSYGSVSALKNVSLHVNHGEICALLGANGAGKTSLLQAISGLAPLVGGKIAFKGHDISRKRPGEIVRLGISHCPEGRRIFPEMTVLENLQLGAFTVEDRNIIKSRIQVAYGHFPVLFERRQQKAGTLSGGEQQMLALSRALMSSPEILMLDEPSLGLAPKIIELIFKMITKINADDKVTVLLVEQNANEALLHSHRAYVLENGRINESISGNSRELRKIPEIIGAYLGGK